MQEKKLYIGDLAKESGLSTHTIRYYEKLLLLDKPERLTSGYRVYPSGCVERLLFIRKAQALGFSLEEIRNIFILSKRGEKPCSHVREVAQRKMGELRQKIEECRQMEAKLKELLKHWDEVLKNSPTGTICPHIEEL